MFERGREVRKVEVAGERRADAPEEVTLNYLNAWPQASI